MSSPFTLTIDWLAFTLPSGSAQDTMLMLGGDWTKSHTGFRGYPASWITTSASRGMGKLGTRAPRAPLEVHVDLSAGIVAPWQIGKVRTVLQWVLKQDGHLTRLDCALDDRNSCVPLSTIRQAIEAGQCVTPADRMQSISSSSIHNATPSGETIYLGSPQSQIMLRIYDNRLESQSKQRGDWQDYGIRWELELKKDRTQVCGQVLSYLELLKHKYGSRSVETELVFPNEAQTRLNASNTSRSLNLALEKAKMTDFHAIFGIRAPHAWTRPEWIYTRCAAITGAQVADHDPAVCASLSGEPAGWHRSVGCRAGSYHKFSTSSA